MRQGHCPICYNFKVIRQVISGWIEFHQNDIAIIKSIFGDSVTYIKPSDYVTHRVARFDNALEEVLDKLGPYWGQFEWIVDAKP